MPIPCGWTRRPPTPFKKGRLHQKVATTIFFESNGGQLKAEATLGEIKAAAGGPAVNLADIDHVLDGLINNCYYLNVDRNRYRFSITPNVNKILTDRRAAVTAKQIDDLLRGDIEKAFRVQGQGLRTGRTAVPGAQQRRSRSVRPHAGRAASRAAQQRGRHAGIHGEGHQGIRDHGAGRSRPRWSSSRPTAWAR